MVTTFIRADIFRVSFQAFLHLCHNLHHLTQLRKHNDHVFAVPLNIVHVNRTDCFWLSRWWTPPTNLLLALSTMACARAVCHCNCVCWLVLFVILLQGLSVFAFFSFLGQKRVHFRICVIDGTYITVSTVEEPRQFIVCYEGHPRDS